MNRRARKREARRQEMLDVAMGIVEQDGLEGLTIARLAEALDAAVGALYRYFPGKDALLLAMQQQALQDFYDFLEDRLKAMMELLTEEGHREDKVLVAQLQLQLLMAAYLEDARLAPARHRLIFAFMTAYEPALGEEEAVAGEGGVMQLLSLASRSVAVLLDAAEDSEETWQNTMLTWALVHGLDHLRKRDRLTPPHLHTTALLPLSYRNLFRGWGVSKEDVEAAHQWFDAHHEALFTAEEEEPTADEKDA